MYGAGCICIIVLALLGYLILRIKRWLKEDTLLVVDILLDSWI